jgi:hypothetical protein
VVVWWCGGVVVWWCGGVVVQRAMSELCHERARSVGSCCSSLALQALRFAFNQASQEATDAAKTKPKRETLGPDLQ